MNRDNDDNIEEFTEEGFQVLEETMINQRNE
jgi:hypothetical protein